MNNQQMPYSYMEYLSPDLKDYKTYSNFNTPMTMPRRDTSEMILKQTKASLNKSTNPVIKTLHILNKKFS